MEGPSTASDYSSVISRPAVRNIPFASVAWAEVLELEVPCKETDIELAGNQKCHCRMFAFLNLLIVNWTSPLGTPDGGIGVSRLYFSRAQPGWHFKGSTDFSIPTLLWHR